MISKGWMGVPSNPLIFKGFIFGGVGGWPPTKGGALRGGLPPCRGGERKQKQIMFFMICFWLSEGGDLPHQKSFFVFFNEKKLLTCFFFFFIVYLSIEKKRKVVMFMTYDCILAILTDEQISRLKFYFPETDPSDAVRILLFEAIDNLGLFFLPHQREVQQ